MMRSIRFICCAVLCLALLAAGGCGKDEGKPGAVDGVMDLTAIEWGTDGPVALEGDWRVCWQQLLSPDRIPADSPSDPFDTAALPGRWKAPSGNMVAGAFSLDAFYEALNPNVRVRYHDMNTAGAADDAVSVSFAPVASPFLAGVDFLRRQVSMSTAATGERLATCFLEAALREEAGRTGGPGIFMPAQAGPQPGLSRPDLDSAGPFASGDVPANSIGHHFPVLPCTPP